MKLSLCTASLLLAVGLCLLSAPRTGAGADEKKLPEGKSVLTADVIKSTRRLGGEDNRFCDFKTVEVKDQSFTKAIRAKVKEKPESPWDAQISTLTAVPVKEGDILLVSFWVRTIESKNDGGKGYFSIYFGVPESGLEQSVADDITVGDKWKKVQMPARAAASYESGKAMLNFDMGYEPQTLEFGDIQVINYGDKAKLSDLPSSGN